MAEGLQPAPEHDEVPVVPSLEQTLHEVNHDSSVSQVEARSAESQARLLNMVSPERRAEIIAQTTPNEEDVSEPSEAVAEDDKTDLREAA
jgi:hypothetical protein